MSALTPLPDNHPVAGKEAQEKRRKHILGLHREQCGGLFSQEGVFLPHLDPDWRWYLWSALSFLEGDAEMVAKADAMLARAVELGGGHFWTSAASSILVRHVHKLSPATRDALLEQFRKLLPGECGHTFRGYNDNFPSMAAVALLVGAPLAGRSDLIADGIRTLETARRLLSRRGLLSEFTSPTYSPITLTCLAEIVQWCPDPAARELALWCEHRVWMDLCAHIHPGTGALAGPHSRAYMPDLCGHPHNAHTVLFQVFGDALPFHPANALFPYQEGQVTHNGPHHIRNHLPWHAVPFYHVPAEAANLVLERRHPLTVHATAEQSAMQRNVWSAERHPDTPLAEVPASSLELSTYMEDDFALGTSDRPFLDGYQMSVCHLLYRRHRPARSLADVAALFPRYLTTITEPDRHQHLNDQGRAFAVASGGSALVAYKARAGWSQTPPTGDPTREPCTSLRLSLLLTCFGAQPQELWLGDRQLENWDARSENPQSIFLADGPVYLAIHPLEASNLGRRHALEIRMRSGFGIFDLFNYQGSPRTFNAHELAATLNGFALEVSCCEFWESFAAFRDFHSRARINSQYSASDAMWLLEYEREALSLGMELSPISDGIKCRTVNGCLAPSHAFRIIAANSSTDDL